MIYNFKDKIAVVTGGTKGLGLGIAKKLSHKGSKVILVARSEDVLRENVKNLESEAAYVQADLTNLDGIQDTAEKIVAKSVELSGNQEGRIDILVNVSGLAKSDDEVAETPEYEDVMRALNKESRIRLSEAFLPYIRREGGYILTLSSHVSDPQVRKSLPGNKVYGGLMEEMDNYFRNMAQEERKNNVFVYSIAPGLADTPGGRSLVNYLIKRGVVEKEKITEEFWADALKPSDVADRVIKVMSSQPDQYFHLIESKARF